MQPTSQPTLQPTPKPNVPVDIVNDVIAALGASLGDEDEESGPKVPCWKSHVCSHGTCFHGSGTVLLEVETGGTKKTLTKTMDALKVGDRVQTANFAGELSFSPVVFLPHRRFH